ncbi:hypothetical protein ACH3XW_20375 [Acanthocheilonema viteae]|uniref:Uncharacterized protein n=1 Tax=Acanthocheilonema viteae TaxID=6277 RepID=A0A498SRN1_ACAVI|nr:unnamed protein product [Acanthocheilonema viteae]
MSAAEENQHKSSTTSSLTSLTASQSSMLWNIRYLEMEIKHINDARDSRIIKLQYRINHFNVKMFEKIENMELERNRIIYASKAKVKH